MEGVRIEKTYVDQVYEVILNAVCDGDLKAGDRLTQEMLAARLNVSRQPVTHALAILKAQGFLTEVGRRGLVVAPVDPQLLAALYQFRSAVEPLAVGLATPRLTSADIKVGNELITRGSAMVAAGDPRGILQADMDFHSFIYRMSGNFVIVESMTLHWHQMRRAMREVLSYPGLSSNVWQEHEAILKAMVVGDPESAAKLMREHLTSAYNRLVGSLSA